MKKYLMALTYVAFISFMVHQKATAQDNEDDIELEPARNIIKIAPFQFVDNTFFLAYEGFMPDFTKSINVGIGFKTRNGFNSEELGFKYEIQYRFYVNGFKEHVPKKSEAKYRRGIYASVYLAGLRTEITSDFNSFDPVGNFTMFRTNERNHRYSKIDLGNPLYRLFRGWRCKIRQHHRFG